ncbi:MAG: DNA polymerase III subunit gamma/tau [Rhodocyclaceae bacterium]|nr:DNA polymerase III subunit gamma/tau [Rhodocyclaceae bacterium]
MSYQALARKWRPKSFSTLVGQEHVVRALTHALEQQRLHHAYLFTGTRGVGKTTIARILAKALNCETGITATPCGTCGACTEIDSGRFVDYIEMDAASNRGVDDMAALLEQAAYTPARGRYKVYVIDEVHQLSGHAFNAMLKTLEEPPEHVKFILATTDPQKIPVTVLSRCLQFNLKQMPPQHIIEHLTRILGAEKVPFEPLALRHIAKGAAGSMRDALSLLDQAIAHGAGRVEEEGVRDMLGTVGEDYLYGLLDGLSAGDLPAMLQLADAMDGRSLSFDGALLELASLFHRVALVQMAPGAIADEAERVRLAAYAAVFDAEYLQLAYQIVTHGRADLPLAPDEYSGFTMCLLRLHAFRPMTPPALAAGGAQGGGRKVATPGPSAAVTLPARSAAPEPKPAQVTPLALPLPVVAVSPLASPAGEAPDGAMTDDWHDILARLDVGGLARELGQHCELLGISGDLVKLRLTTAHKQLLMTSGPADKLQAALSGCLGRPMRLQVDLGETVAETPAERLALEKQARHDRAVEALEQDGFVREVIEVFDATLNESSIKPLDRPIQSQGSD